MPASPRHTDNDASISRSGCPTLFRTSYSILKRPWLFDLETAVGLSARWPVRPEPGSCRGQRANAAGPMTARRTSPSPRPRRPPNTTWPKVPLPIHRSAGRGSISGPPDTPVWTREPAIGRYLGDVQSPLARRLVRCFCSVTSPRCVEFSRGYCRSQQTWRHRGRRGAGAETFPGSRHIDGRAPVTPAGPLIARPPLRGLTTQTTGSTTHTKVVDKRRGPSVRLVHSIPRPPSRLGEYTRHRGRVAAENA